MRLGNAPGAGRTEDAPEAGLLQREGRAALVGVLADLDPGARAALLLSSEGFCGHEIAAAIGRSEAATRTLLCRTRMRVRSRLESAEAVPMKPHDTFLELAAIAIDFPLAPADRGRLEQHLASCPACARRASAFRGDALALGHLPAVILPERRAVRDPHGRAAPGRRPPTRSGCSSSPPSWGCCSWARSPWAPQLLRQPGR